MTAERKLIFDQLINQEQPTSTLIEMAGFYERNGLTDQADLLRKRAKLRDLSPETKAAHKQAFRDGMSSKDPDGVEALAKAFAKQGKTGNAAALRTYARNLRTTQALASVQTPAANATPEGATAH